MRHKGKRQRPHLFSYSWTCAGPLAQGLPAGAVARPAGMILMNIAAAGDADRAPTDVRAVGIAARKLAPCTRHWARLRRRLLLWRRRRPVLTCHIKGLQDGADADLQPYRKGSELADPLLRRHVGNHLGETRRHEGSGCEEVKESFEQAKELR